MLEWDAGLTGEGISKPLWITSTFSVKIFVNKVDGHRISFREEICYIVNYSDIAPYGSG